PFHAPHHDYHALAPEIVLTVAQALVLVADLFIDRERKWVVGNIASFGLLAATVPIVSLAVFGDDTRSMLGNAYVVDRFSLVLKGLFLAGAYIVLLMGSRYVEEGDYYECEFYFLILSSVLGLIIMSSHLVLIPIRVPLET